MEGRLESVLDDFMPPSPGLHALMAARDRYRPQRLEALVSWLKHWFRDTPAPECFTWNTHGQTASEKIGVASCRGG